MPGCAEITVIGAIGSSSGLQVFTDEFTAGVQITTANQQYHSLSFTLTDTSTLLIIISENIRATNGSAGPYHNMRVALDGVDCWPRGVTANGYVWTPVQGSFASPHVIQFLKPSVASGNHTLTVRTSKSNSTGTLEIDYSLLLVMVIG